MTKEENEIIIQCINLLSSVNTSLYERAKGMSEEASSNRHSYLKIKKIINELEFLIKL